jgi:hypothetical protein
MTDRPNPQPTDVSRRWPGRPAFALAVLALSAVTVRLLYFSQFSDNPWFHYTLTDE